MSRIKQKLEDCDFEREIREQAKSDYNAMQRELYYERMSGYGE